MDKQMDMEYMFRAISYMKEILKIINNTEREVNTMDFINSRDNS